MTERLYYDQPYLTEFDAVVTACREEEGGCGVALDRSAFYPTSGGQPFDTGVLCALGQETAVTDVTVEDDTVWHHVQGPLPVGTAVAGRIDWARRWDHMQQHGGEHLLAGCIWHLFRGVTRGLHVGGDCSTIDVKMPDGETHLSKEQTEELELLVNRRIQQDAPIRCWFPSPEELATLPLRKPSTVTEHVRVVAAGDFEMVPCGGTHPSSTGQMGLIKVLSTLPARGFMRVSFVVGERALRYVLACHEAVTGAGRLLSAAPDTLVKAVTRLTDENAALHASLKALREESADMQAENLLKSARPFAHGRYIAATLQGFDMVSLKDMALALVKNEGTVALLAAENGEDTLLAFACSDNMPLDMGDMMRKAGAKGGGKKDLAQGKALDKGALERAVRLLTEA